jgi:hypothetical protein
VARVGDFEQDELTGRVVARRDREPPAARHRVARVEGEIHHDLLQLTGIGLRRAEPRVEVGHELDLRAEQPAEHPLELGDHLVDVDDLRLEHLAAAEGEQLSGQPGGTLSRALHLEHVLAHRGAVVELRERELAVAHDRRQQVVEVVGDAAREPPDRLHLLRLAQLLFEPAPLGHVGAEGDAPASLALDEKGAVPPADQPPLSELRHDRRLDGLRQAVREQVARVLLERVVDQLGRQQHLEGAPADHLLGRVPGDARRLGVEDHDPGLVVDADDERVRALDQSRRVVALLLEPARELRPLEHEGGEVREPREQRELGLAEMPVAVAVADAEHADDLARDDERHAGGGADAGAAEHRYASGPLGVVRDGDRPVLHPDAPGQPFAATELGAAVVAEHAQGDVEHHPVAQAIDRVEIAVRRSHQRGRTRDERLEDLDRVRSLEQVDGRLLQRLELGRAALERTAPAGRLERGRRLVRERLEHLERRGGREQAVDRVVDPDEADAPLVRGLERHQEPVPVPCFRAAPVPA